MSILVRNVSKRFGDFVAVDDVSLEVESGSLTALLGPSGSGKSTLLRIIAGLETPDAGEIVLSGKDATALAPQKRNVGFVFQHYAAFKHMTVRDNVAFGLKVRKRPKAEIRERVDELLNLVQLQNFGDRYPAQLSGGQRQRMGLARALAPEPQVLLLDEPFGALDARVRAELREWLRQLHDVVHVTTVFVTHDQSEAMEISDQIAVINHGRLEQVGGPRELYDEPASEFVMTFVGDANLLGDVLVRPHDVELLHEPAEGALEAMIVRVTILGRDAKVELHGSTGAEIVSLMTRDKFDEAGFWRGQTVWVRPQRERVFAADSRQCRPQALLADARGRSPQSISKSTSGTTSATSTTTGVLFPRRPASRRSRSRSAPPRCSCASVPAHGGFEIDPVRAPPLRGRRRSRGRSRVGDRRAQLALAGFDGPCARCESIRSPPPCALYHRLAPCTDALRSVHEPAGARRARRRGIRARL